MPFTRFDDKWRTNPKLLRAIAKEGDSAALMWVVGVTYCNDHLTDGRIPREAVSTFVTHKKPLRVAAALVDSGCWEADGDDFLVHDFLDWNDSRATVLAGREATKKRKETWLAKKRAEAEARNTPIDSDEPAAYDESGTRSANANGTRSGRVAAASTGRCPTQPYPTQPYPERDPERARTRVAQEGPTEADLSPEQLAILAALRAEPPLVDVATARFAIHLAKKVPLGGKLDGIVGAIVDASNTVGAHTAAEGVMAATEVADLVSRYVATALRRRADRYSGPAPKPQEPLPPGMNPAGTLRPDVEVAPPPWAKDGTHGR